MNQPALPFTPRVTQTAGGEDDIYQTKTYITTYTYYNTLLAANKPFVITSKQTVENIVTIPLPNTGNFIECTGVTFDTQTYYTTRTFTRTVGEEVVTSQEVLTQVVITEGPTVERSSVQPTQSSLVTKTYFTTLTYYNTALEGESTIVSTNTVVSSEVVTETTYITEAATQNIDGFILSPTPSLQHESLPEVDGKLVLYATKTVYTTLTYLTTILQGSQTITASSIEISSNIVTEPLVSAPNSEELLSHINLYLANQVTTTPVSGQQPQTIAYVHISDNLYKQYRTFFATYTHCTTMANGLVNSRVETQTKVLTSLITTTSVPASLFITPSSIISTHSPGTNSVPESGTALQLDPSYLSALKSSVLASQSTGAKPGNEGLQATMLVEDDDVSGTFVVSDSTTSVTLLVKPTDVLSTSVLSGQTVVILDSVHLSSLKSSFLATPTVSGAVSPTPVISISVLDSSTILTGFNKQNTTVGAGEPVIVVVHPAVENNTSLPDNPMTVRPAVFPIPDAFPVPTTSPDVLSTSEDAGDIAGTGGVSITGNQENGLNIDLGPVFSAVAGILQNNLNNQLASPKSDDNRRKINTPLHPPNTIVAAQREPLLIPVGGVGASLSSSQDHTDDGERVFIPLRRPTSSEAQPRFPSRATPIHESSPGFIRISAERPRPEHIGLSPPIHISEMEGFGPTFRPPSTQLGFTAMTEEALGPTRVSVISGSQTIFFGGINPDDLPPPGLPATLTDVDQTTVVLQPSQAVFSEESRPVPVPVRVAGHNAGGTVLTKTELLDQVAAAGDNQPHSVLSRPSPKMPQPSRVGPQTIVSIEGDNRIVRTQVIHAQPVDEYRPEAPIIISPARGEFILQSTVGVGILSGDLNNDNRPRPPTGLDGTVLTGSETVLVGQGVDNGRTTVVRGSSTVLSGATTIFGSLFTRPVANSEPQGDLTSVVSGPRGIPTRLITRIETTARTITATRTDVVFTAGTTSTMTQVIHSTLPIRTAITTIVGTSTKVNYVTATHNPSASISHTRFKEDDPTTYPPGSPFDPANFPSFPIDPRPEEDELRLPGDAEVVLNEASLGIAEDNEISRVVESKSPDQEINVGGPLRAPISKCNPQCSAARQEVCKLIRGLHTCVCRAGHARRNRYDSCKPSLAYNIQLLLDGISDRQLIFDPVLRNTSHPITQELADNTVHGIEEVMMASQLAPHYHTASVIKFIDTKEIAMPASAQPMERGVVAEIKLELSKSLENDHENEDNLSNERILRKALEMSLKNTNYSLAGTELYANREASVLASQDFDECSHEEHNDCSGNAHCFNTPGSYLCTCRDGFKDMDDMPGRECAVQTEQCSFCNFQGECITKADGTHGCRCLQWFSGDRCQINLRGKLDGVPLSIYRCRLSP
ncbi:hypothetical protein SK128_012253 [Halocaridina rubra]|uniref:EGF-like domain-containing protein n=1 Tax=Halocaridina rubra TaxID=373956 RepID=A0AAN8WME1_HALRR